MIHRDLVPERRVPVAVRIGWRRRDACAQWPAIVGGAAA